MSLNTDPMTNKGCGIRRWTGSLVAVCNTKFARRKIRPAGIPVTVSQMAALSWDIANQLGKAMNSNRWSSAGGEVLGVCRIVLVFRG